MNFFKFIFGGLLILGSFGFGMMLLIGSPFALMGGTKGFWSLIIFGVIDFVVFLSGIYLMRSTRH